MRALNVPAAGQRPQLADLPKPTVTDGAVLVRVKAASLNAVDNAIAAGRMAAMIPHEYPLILGRDAAGVVEEIGTGVDHVAVGDEVLAHVMLSPPVQAGTLAEYVVVPGASVTRKPAGLDFTHAAALPLAGAAASAAVDAVDPRPGQTVLVNGASGGVGSYAVQLLAARGATVLATGTAADVDRLRDLGASAVIDYTAGPVADQVLADHPGGVDALVNLNGFTLAEVPLAAVRRGGAVSTTTRAPDEQAAAEAGVTASSVMAGPVREVVAPLAEQAAAGELKIDVGTVIPLERALDGLATLADGHAQGKIVVTIDA